MSAKKAVKKIPQLIILIIGLASIYWLAWRTGLAFACYGFIGPDACWLLKLGEIITQSHAIPKQDPFSYTLPMMAQAGDPQPYIVYQWLSEVIFYNFLNWFGHNGLTFFCASIGALAFLVLPLRLYLRAGVPLVWAFLMIGAASYAVSMRSLVRPEIFSVLFLSFCLAILQVLRADIPIESKSSANARLSWSAIVGLLLIFVFWANTHTGFISGIIVMFIYFLSFLVSDQIARRSLSNPTKTLGIALLTSIVATLINPYGVKLWLYLPRIFFLGFNDQIAELRPLGWNEMFSPVHISLLALLILFYGGLAFQFYRKRDQLSLATSPLQLASLGIVVIASALCFYRRRLVSISALLILVESAYLIAGLETSANKFKSFWSRKVSILLVELMAVKLNNFAVNYF
jgi:hypothetical protein